VVKTLGCIGSAVLFSVLVAPEPAWAQAAPPAPWAVPTGLQAVPPAPQVAAAPPVPRREVVEPLGTEGDAPDPFVWRYPTVRTSEYVMTGGFGVLAIVGLVIPTAEPRWTAPTGIDTGVRDAFRLEGRESRKTADDISDLTLTVGLNYAAFDAAVVAWALRGKGSVAYQMAAINIEVLAVTAGITGITKAIAARQRPYAEECRTDPVLRRADDCEPEAVNVSFLSGHSSIAFAAASVTCMHHAHLGLYASPAADVAACFAAYGAATTTGLLRILSDNHYATDVASGAALGTLVGVGVPWLLHYRTEVPDDDAATHPMDEVSLTVVPGPMSATILGVF
jgi:membrane-associated phospholipid phosphatase